MTAVPPGVLPHYVDVTADFAAATATLAPGSLALAETFELGNAINALEIMDAKMDTGLLDMRSADAEYDTAAPRSGCEVLGIMDELFGLHMAWHTGGALTQSVFTCLYVEQALMNYDVGSGGVGRGGLATAHFMGPPSETVVEDIEEDEETMFVHVALRAFVLATVRSCELARRTLQCRQIYEDEDIVTSTYSLDLLQAVPTAEVLVLVQGAITKLQKRSLRSTNGDSKICMAAMMHRLQLCCSMLKIFDMNAVDTRDLETLANEALSHLGAANDTHAHSTPVPAAFSIAIQGRLEAAMPLRPAVEGTFASAVDTARRLLEGLIDILRVQKLARSEDAEVPQVVGSIGLYFEDFATRRPLNLPYVRASLFRQFLDPRRAAGGGGAVVAGKFTMREVIVADITGLCCPPPALFTMTETHPARRAFDEFMAKAEVCYETLFSTMCHNKCRQRQQLCRVLLDWDSLQVDSETLEMMPEMEEFVPLLSGSEQDGEELRALPLSSWVYFRKLEIMGWILYAGFELEIYTIEEWPLILWYGLYILGVTEAHIVRIENVLTVQRQGQGQYEKHRKRNHKHTGTTVAAPEAAVNHTRQWLAALRARVDMFKDLTRALMYLMAALEVVGAVRGRDSSASKYGPAYSTAELQYALRLKPFSTVGVPDLPTYDAYATSTSSWRDWPLEHLLTSAQNAAASAQTRAGAWKGLGVNDALVRGTALRAQQLALLRTCVSTTVAVLRLRQALAPGEGSAGDIVPMVVSAESAGGHPCFPVLQVVVQSSG
ncbi:Mak10 subunit, NatC N-terminal acetyltransferase-domain-containing protein [Limtongia smithiae]|uniref:Mak10 subunit, NatC N-terminal acetyltransferase-domain-containing protein n=1 Tax=Limtongia smithiae TaxID=1125753 RepID=UPI0034CFDDF0